MTISKAFQLFSTEAPAHAAAWMDGVRGLGAACALDAKTRDLAYLSVLAAQGLVSGVPFHTISAKSNGATREEVISAVLLGLPAAGNVAPQSLPAALEAFDDAASSARPMAIANPQLYIFSGLPGSGKSTLAQRLAQETGAVWLRIDTIEDELRELCAVAVQGEGYGIAYRLAADNLRLGLSVIADCCNPIELTRSEWMRTATEAGADWCNIEIACSKRDEHRRRVEKRLRNKPGSSQPTWSEIERRVYDPWSAPRIRIDTAGCSEAESFAALLAALARGKE